MKAIITYYNDSLGKYTKNPKYVVQKEVDFPIKIETFIEQYGDDGRTTRLAGIDTFDIISIDVKL